MKRDSADEAYAVVGELFQTVLGCLGFLLSATALVLLPILLFVVFVVLQIIGARW